MKLIILAAGKGTRLVPLTNTVPKPLIKIMGKTIIEHNLENILTEKNISLFDEIIIVVKYLKEKFPQALGYNYKGIKISYHEQIDKKGTAAALMGLENIKDDVLIINGDSILSKKDFDKIINFDGYAVLAKKVDNPSKYGIFQVDSDNIIQQVIEKPSEFVGDLANLGVYKFSSKIFELLENIKESKRGEYEITDIINLFAKIYPLKALKILGEFIDVSYSWDILKANSYFLSKLEKSEINGIIEENVTIKGNIVLEKGAILKSGTYIEGNCYIGENTIVGPNIYLRGNTVIGNNCKIGANNEIKNSSIGDNTNIAHLSYVGDSVIGNNVNVGGGFISANLRHDEDNVKVLVKGKLIDTGLRKLGVIVGDNVKIGVRVCSMPGRIVENDTIIMPGEIIK